ncbi:hypothetical protein DPMN_163558 [Dreissena polymorpha]|uniref:Uncharacterized protein n=1 Tax=Dreissena polymorpha TaxID=45954 RepID=A0A9D4ETM3_DREPO|nr:hypothetical protein DPMN_163558 [Dreissena polymorpha]
MVGRRGSAVTCVMAWKKKISMIGSCFTGVMEMEEEGWYEMDGCHWCHGHRRRLL